MTDSAIKYVGVDSCTGGWVAVGLGAGGESCVKVFGSGEFPKILEHFGGACVVLVDMPIGLSDITHDETCTKRRSTCDEIARTCDKEARSCLGSPRSSSVFTAPPRKLVDKKIADPAWGYNGANLWLTERLGCKRGITQQTYSIIHKIIEVEEYLNTRGSDSPIIREAHPEVCFWALNGKQPMLAHKSEAFGLWERLKIVQCSLHASIDVLDMFKEVCPRESKKRIGADDVLDALALAITAKLGWQNGFRRLPEDLPTDFKKPKPPEMVYYVIPNEK